MTYSKNSIWIDLEYKDYYSDSKSQGLYVYYDKTYDNTAKESLNLFISWLKNKFFFPIRCNIFIEDKRDYCSSKKGYRCQGIFYGVGDFKRTRLPRIYIAGNAALDYVIFAIAHELTHYFQWYFFQDNDISERHLEAEANKYAKWLTYSFLKDNNMLS